MTSALRPRPCDASSRRRSTAATSSSSLTGSARKSRAPLRTASRMASASPVGPTTISGGRLSGLEPASAASSARLSVSKRSTSTSGGGSRSDSSVRPAVADRSGSSRRCQERRPAPRPGAAAPVPSGRPAGLSASWPSWFVIPVNRPAALTAFGTPRLSRGNVDENVRRLEGRVDERDPDRAWSSPRCLTRTYRIAAKVAVGAPASIQVLHDDVRRSTVPSGVANTAAFATAGSPTAQTAATRAARRAPSWSTSSVNTMRPNSTIANSSMTSSTPTIANSTVVVPCCRTRASMASSGNCPHRERDPHRERERDRFGSEDRQDCANDRSVRVRCRHLDVVAAGVDDRNLVGTEARQSRIARARERCRRRPGSWPAPTIAGVMLTTPVVPSIAFTVTKRAALRIE